MDVVVDSELVMFVHLIKRMSTSTALLSLIKQKVLETRKFVI